MDGPKFDEICPIFSEKMAVHFFFGPVGPNKCLSPDECLSDWPQILHVDRGDNREYADMRTSVVSIIVFELAAFQNFEVLWIRKY